MRKEIYLAKFDHFSAEFSSISDPLLSSRCALDDISLEFFSGESLALVGASGSGKSLLSKSMIGMLPQEILPSSGSFSYEGEILYPCNHKKWQNLRGREIGLIPQDPLQILHPTLKIGYQLREMIDLHHRGDYQHQIEHCSNLLEHLALADAKTLLKAYPHQLSGGMRQRVAIALSLLAEPKLLICDEITTALDPITKQVLLAELKRLQKLGSSLLFISHDLGLVASFAQRIAVMHEGSIIELAYTQDLFSKPRHHYTKKLLCSTLGYQRSSEPLYIGDQNIDEALNEENRLAAVWAYYESYFMEH